jgi:hypothetical protein
VCRGGVFFLQDQTEKEIQTETGKSDEDNCNSKRQDKTQAEMLKKERRRQETKDQRQNTKYKRTRGNGIYWQE